VAKSKCFGKSEPIGCDTSFEVARDFGAMLAAAADAAVTGRAPNATIIDRDDLDP
jgi:hypothetical protein